jgi:glycosyltransferase involved in cell wall biosynthesis
MLSILQLKDVRLGLFWKDFAYWCAGASCVGLTVAGSATATVLREYGIDVSVFPVKDNMDVVHAIDGYNESHNEPLTHVVISAPWLSLHDLTALVENFEDTQFVILCHSNVGFLQCDPGGVELLRDYKKLSRTHPNLKVGGNSKKFVEWFDEVYGNIIWLPNLYPVSRVPFKARNDEVLKIGAFGAVRPEKNFMTAAGAALVIQKYCGIPVELHMSEGGESDHTFVIPAIEQMCEGVPNFKLIRHEWCFWDKFIEIIRGMDILLQPSFTESFNMITADGISVGVPSVVSPVITWAPNSWKADPDNALDIAEKAISILVDTVGLNIELGADAVSKHDKIGLAQWFEYLLGISPMRAKLMRFKKDFWK